MGDRTAIEWTRGDDGTAGATWNPMSGCSRVSPGCDHCYAETIANRFAGSKAFPNGFQVTLRPDRLDQPLRWKRPRRIFVNSTSDLFHDEIPTEYIARVFAVMALTPRHTFQFLTKRHGRMRSLLDDDQFIRNVWNESESIRPREQHPDITDWPLRNVWAGVSTENQQWANIRIPALLQTPAAVRWISAEPLLGPIDLTRIPAGSKGQPLMVYDVVNARYGVPDRWQQKMSVGLDWVVVGGESGRGARPMHADWARSIRDQCEQSGTPFFFKQHGEYVCTQGFDDPWREPDVWVNRETGETADEATACAAGGDWAGAFRVGKKHAGRELDGQTWDQYPQAACVS